MTSVSSTATTTTTVEDIRARLAAELANVQNAIATLTDREKALKAQLLETCDGPDSYSAGALTVVVKQAMRIDTRAVADKYPPDARPELYKQTVDLDAVKRHIAPVDLEALQVPSAPSVTLR